MTVPTDLPETIPPGEYVLVVEFHVARALVCIGEKFHPQFERRIELSIAAEAVYVTEAQARHLLAMPGRPHDDRLDGPKGS